MTHYLSPLRYDYLPLETVIQGRPAGEAVAERLAAYDKSRALFITSGSLNRQTPVIEEMTSAVGASCAGVFDTVRAHTPREDVLRALTQAREVGADSLVAVGGGSIIDATKTLQFALNIGATSADDLTAYARFSDGRRGARVGEPLPTPAQPVRQIAVPTTLSGAEFSNTAGVLDESRGQKEGYRAPDLCPRAIVYDPAITVHTPAWLWLSTAIRSLDHAIEGYCAADAYPFLQGQFLHAMGLLAQSLPRVKADPHDLEARSLNQQAVWSACCGLGRVSHGASHGIGYLLGSLCDVPHGHTSCVMLPAVLAWNAAVNGDRQTAIATALGAGGGDAATAVKDLVESLDLPSRLRDVGVRAEQLDRVAEAAARHPVVQRNPRPIAGASDVRAILDLAW